MYKAVFFNVFNSVTVNFKARPALAPAGNRQNYLCLTLTAEG